MLTSVFDSEVKMIGNHHRSSTLTRPSFPSRHATPSTIYPDRTEDCGFPAGPRSRPSGSRSNGDTTPRTNHSVQRDGRNPTSPVHWLSCGSTSCNAEERSLNTGSTSHAKVQKTLEVPLVQCIDLIVHVTVYGNTKYEPSGQYRRRKKLLRFGFSYSDRWQCSRR